MSSGQYIPLQHNESYWLLDGELLAAYQSLGSSDFSRYPDYEELRERIAAYAGVTPDQVCIGAGSDSLIQLLAQQFAREGRRALLPVPTFYGYERIFARAKLPIDTATYTMVDDGFVFPLHETLDLIAASSGSVLFLSQPNNPLGCDIPASDFRAILDAAAKAQVCVVSDEAYFEFSGMTAIDRLDKQDIVILRTFSKGFGLSGGRIGYSIASAERTSALHEQQLPWPVAHPSVYAAIQGLKMREKLAARVALVGTERELFRDELNALPGVTAYPSATNFVLIKVPDVERVAEEFARSNIGLARTDSMSAIPDAQALISSTIRLSIPSPEHRLIVLEAIHRALDKG